MEIKPDNYLKLFFLSFISASIGIYTSTYIFKRYKFKREYNKLNLLRETRIFQKKENLKRYEDYLNGFENYDFETISNKSFSETIKLLKTEDEARDKILHAYQKKAFDTNLKTNCVVEFLDIDKSEINYNGPLAGLPISIKDNLCVKNYYSCAGCSKLLIEPATSNCVLVDVIKDLGGVPFVKTTVPQTMMSFLSSNPIDGITLNPLDPSKSPGGSSSGEGALIGGHGSIVGFGTDIGGSVRLPAAFCGVVGLKPTGNRISKKGMLKLKRESVVNSVCGILGRDVESIVYVFEHIVNSPLHRTLDPTVVPLDFNTKLFQSKSKIKIGYFFHNDSYHCVPAVVRCVLETVKALRNHGYEVVYWKPPVSGEEWLIMFLTALGIDRASDIRQLCRYDKHDFTIKNLLKMFEMNYFQYLYLVLKAKLENNRELLMWLRVSQGVSTAAKICKLIEEIASLRDHILTDWVELGIDVLICPMAGFVAVPVKPSGSLTGMLSYQNLWNLVDFPAGTVPISKVKQSDIDELEKSYPKHKSPWHFNTFTAQKDSLHMPVSVQCVAKPWEDENCLRIMKEIQDLFDYHS